MFSWVADMVTQWWFVLICILNFVFILFLFLSEHSDPRKFLVWTLLFILLPIVGFVLYLAIGQSFYTDHAFKIKGVKDDKVKTLDEMDDMLVDQIGSYDPDSAGMMRVVRTIQGHACLTTNNEVVLLTKGEDKFSSLFTDLRKAKKFIHMEYYLLTNDGIGNELLEILTQKASEGLEVRFVTDYVGGHGSKKAIKKFKEAGGKYATFHTLKTTILTPKKNNRNHRKIAVIDGEISYCGGFNIGDDYVGKGPLGYWRDTAVRIRGSATLFLGLRFAKDWEYASKEVLELNLKYLPRSTILDVHGDIPIQIVSGGPDSMHKNPVRIQYLEMFMKAKKTIWIHSPYFIPNDSMIDVLGIAAASGVDVRVIFPEKPDHAFIYWNNISSAYPLMKAGVKVYMYNKGFVHSKTVVVDGQYCSVGSANMDDRSLVHNFETNALIYSEKIGKEMMDAFEEDLESCRQYSCEEYESRTWGQKVKTSFANLIRNLA